MYFFSFSDRHGNNGVAMTSSSQYPYNNRHGQPIQPIRPQQQQTYLPQYNNNLPQLPPTNGGVGYNLNDTPVFQRPQPGPQQPPSSVQVQSYVPYYQVLILSYKSLDVRFILVVT